MFIAALFVAVPNWKELRYFQWVNAEQPVVHLYQGILLNNKKEPTVDRQNWDVSSGNVS